MKNFAAAAFALLSLAGCATQTEETAGSAAGSEASLSTVPTNGPLRLRGACFEGYGNAPKFFDADTQAGATSVHLGLHGGSIYQASVQISKAPPYQAMLRITKGHLWSGAIETTSEVTKTLNVGESIALRDDVMTAPTPYFCSATLVHQGTILVGGMDDKPAPLVALSEPRAAIDITLPNQIICGAKLSFASPVTATAVQNLLGAVAVSGDGEFNVDVTPNADGTIDLTAPPDLRAWTVHFVLESRDHRTSLATVMRTALGLPNADPIGTLSLIRCPQQP